MYGDICYHFFCGMLFESWKSRTIAHIDRVGFAWSACIFFAGMHNFLKINPATCNRNKYGISWQSCDDFIYLGLTLILLIQNWPNFYSDYPLCPWIISTAFLEHIFGYARRIIEDFTVLDFLLMNEKILKTIKIEMKGNLIRPDNNDRYNIKLSKFKENLPKELSNFPSVFEIGNRMRETSNAMKSIFYSLGIKIDQDFLLLIQQLIHSLKKNISSNILLEEMSNDFNLTTQEEIEESDLLELDSNQLDDINEVLIKHQQQLLDRSNLSNNLDLSDLSQIDNEEIHLDSELVIEENFFEQINKIYQQSYKISPLTIMQIMSNYQDNF
ncbi:hypothetical protein C2G38_2041275 [Gigaspora rosea]|uniref:Uncharacterized protein n=1 Tax=Gigaspora rosea TaxID=44941 RepID=A0A397US71_9GLOM|nr:hypothetical protein C2G38_2041275 [Gigaspora rosea]